METIRFTRPFDLPVPTVGDVIQRTDGTFIIHSIVSVGFNPRMRGVNYTYEVRVERTD